MTYESITIPLETEKQNLSRVEAKPVSENMARIKGIFGDIFSSSMKPDQKIIFDYNRHPLYQGFLDAYRNHRPITISPDIIWILIVQGFCHHVKAHSEELRSFFVDFQGKKEISIKRLDINICTATSEDWMSIMPEFVDKITQFTGKNIIDTLSPNFTTTDAVSLAVGQISIMFAMKDYFRYKAMVGGCGLPYVTIEGSIEDWEKILEKMNNLKKFKLEDWINKLTPIIEEIIETKKGNVNKEFWLRMIKYKDQTGSYDTGDYEDPQVDGWFTNFFPYGKNGQTITSPFFPGTSLPDEFLRVPFELKIAKDKNQKEEDMVKVNCEFLAGLIGIIQDEKTGSFKPEIGWIVREEKDIYDIDEARLSGIPSNFIDKY